MLSSSYKSHNSVNEDVCADNEHFSLGENNFCCDIKKDDQYDEKGHAVTEAWTGAYDKRVSYVAPNVCTYAPSKGSLPVSKCICNQGFDFN